MLILSSCNIQQYIDGTANPEALPPDYGTISVDRPMTLDLPAGVYLLEWNDERMQVLRRFVVED
jgi:hypothetical protein